jgi:hypothetical protein
MLISLSLSVVAQLALQLESISGLLVVNYTI